MSNDDLSSPSTPAPPLESALEAQASRAAAASPDHRDMYLLLLGLIVGLVLSPWIGGKYLAEDTFTKWYFYGNDPAFDALADFIHEQEEQTARQIGDAAAMLKLSDATPTAIEEKRLEIIAAAEDERRPYVDAVADARERHRLWMIGFVFTLMIAAAALMFIEPLFDPAGRLAGFRRRLSTGRYAVMAVWIGTVLAKPHYIAMPMLPFLVTLLAVALLAAALPWLLAGRRAE